MTSPMTPYTTIDWMLRGERAPGVDGAVENWGMLVPTKPTMAP